MIAVRQHAIVLIDKAAQSALQANVGKISLPSKFLFMMYNLQHGPVMSIGDDAKRDFPDMEPGDIAIFHHSVESNVNHLLDIDKIEEKDVEYRGVRVTADEVENQVYGILKADGRFIAHPHWVFLSPNISPANKPFVADNIDGVDSSVFKSDAYLIRMMGELKAQIDLLERSLTLSKDISKRMEIRTETNILRGHQDKISAYINSEKMINGTVINIHESVTKNTGIVPGSKVIVTHSDGLIPLSIPREEEGIIQFCLAMTQFVVARYDS